MLNYSPKNEQTLDVLLPLLVPRLERIREQSRGAPAKDLAGASGQILLVPPAVQLQHWPTTYRDQDLRPDGRQDLSPNRTLSYWASACLSDFWRQPSRQQLKRQRRQRQQRRRQKRHRRQRHRRRPQQQRRRQQRRHRRPRQSKAYHRSSVALDVPTPVRPRRQRPPLARNVLFLFARVTSVRAPETQRHCLQLTTSRSTWSRLSSSVSPKVAISPTASLPRPRFRSVDRAQPSHVRWATQNIVAARMRFLHLRCHPASVMSYFPPLVTFRRCPPYRFPQPGYAG